MTYTDWREKIAIVGGRSHPQLVSSICKHLEVPQTPVEIVEFKNHQFLVQLKSSVGGKHVFVIQTTTETNPGRDVLELFFLLDAIRRADAGAITVITPYFPWVRSEKKNQPRIPIPASMIAGILEDYFGINRLITLDLHVQAEQGFVRGIPWREVWAAPLFACAVAPLNTERDCLVATDAGAYNSLEGRYRNAFSFAQFATIQKQRLGDTDQVLPVGLAGTVQDRNCYLFDDEIATGGTLIGDAAFLVEKHGANEVSAFITHGVLAADAPEKIAYSRLARLFVTDTIPVSDEKIARSNGKIKVVSCAPLLAEAIRRSACHLSFQPILTTPEVRGLLTQAS